MVNIKMFRHPKYYKELRKLRNKEARRVLGCLPTNELHNSDQVISANKLDGDMKVRAPGPGLKLRHGGLTPEASGTKLQAPSDSNNKPQASSDKQQASSSKPQALSSKI